MIVRNKIHESFDADASPFIALVFSRAAEKGATEFVVPHVKYGHRGEVSPIIRSARVTFSNLHFYSSPHFWMPITHNTGPITLRNVDLKMPHPETELFVSWRDGLHIKNGRWGTLIEDSDWDGAATYDDSFAIYSRAQKMVGISGNTMITLWNAQEGTHPVSVLQKAGRFFRKRSVFHTYPNKQQP